MFQATKLYCFVHKVPVCGECICFPEHQICVVSELGSKFLFFGVPLEFECCNEVCILVWHYGFEYILRNRLYKELIW